MAIEREELLGWMRRKLSDGDSPETKVHVLTLKFLGDYGKNRDEVDSWEMRRVGSSKLIMDVEQVCDHIIVTCEKETQEIGGTVRFTLFALMHPQSRKSAGTKTLRCYCPIEEEDDGQGGADIRESGSTKNQRNLEQQSHREIMRLYMNGINDVQSRLRIENTDLREDNRTLRSSYLGMITTFERLKNEQVARNLAVAESAQRTEIVAAAGEKLMIFIPHLVNWYFKAPVMKAEVSPIEDALKEALMPLEPEQVMTVLGALNETQRLPIQKLYQKWIEEENTKKYAAAKQLPSATPSSAKPSFMENKEGQTA